ncbi:UNVERIFIED_CONTAM: hypothetical protein Scaly_3032500 [Sesamum calycinum]|uniref:Uncharacterized protein n=1 Tax=Sesamum calycinum TaxID=2727403 RepID=A0AAW2K706_9LAMI
MAATIRVLKWLSYILSDFGISVSLPIQVYCDNQVAMHIMANPVFHDRTKHIELDCHVLADIFTKVLSFKQFLFLLAKLGLAALHPSPTCGGGDVKYTSDERGAILSELQHHKGKDDAGDKVDITFLDSG